MRSSSDWVRGGNKALGIGLSSVEGEGGVQLVKWRFDRQSLSPNEETKRLINFTPDRRKKVVELRLDGHTKLHLVLGANQEFESTQFFQIVYCRLGCVGIRMIFSARGEKAWAVLGGANSG